MMGFEPKQLAADICGGDRRALARGITLIESSKSSDRQAANELLDILMPRSGDSIRIGLSGVPGVGKSTFIESFGNLVIDQGHKIAVLAVDPSSSISGGSILGDKTRMETLSRRLEAFIRPSPAGDTLGGVTRHTRETICLVEAAGFDVVLVETVGVGQSETAVAEMTDMFLLLLLPGGGDELQGIKRGIVELADLIVVNKADGALKGTAMSSAADYRSALGFLPARRDDWQARVATCSALTGEGVDEVWQTIQEFRDTLQQSGALQKHREQQARGWLWGEAIAMLKTKMMEDLALKSSVQVIETAVLNGEMSPWVGATKLIEKFMGKGN
ncbi:MAG: methylmalonyl Co-A mutase-associated GTPase MeaB [Gammaproteobacteria bacterium]